MTTDRKAPTLLESLDSVVGRDGRGLIAAWRQASWLPRDQFDVGVKRMVDSGVVRLVPALFQDRTDDVRKGGMLVGGVLHLVVEKVK